MHIKVFTVLMIKTQFLRFLCFSLIRVIIETSGPILTGLLAEVDIYKRK